ncbi:uncharacterized protein LOC143428655 [Xylocopa sonorina]|uniref:uncharacterized protein LOC143428655 n=1 Tax=Xylocopa sonorina TaxID=1818115 RepID=UPI00403A866F
MNNIIEATILKGKHQGVPVRLAFAMTINEVQGQSLQVCGLDWIHASHMDSVRCESHGHLVRWCSRVGKPSNLFIPAPDRKINNVVYLQGIKTAFSFKYSNVWTGTATYATTTPAAMMSE